MGENLKDRLAGLGAERLAEVLLELAGFNQDAVDAVERLTSTPEERIKQFKAKLTSLKRRRKFVRWGQSAELARELSSLLKLLEEDVTDPKEGVKLVLAFYKTDEATLGRCDDSSGHVGNVFRYDARSLLAKYAANCPDRKWLIEQIFKLILDDGYGVRDSVLDNILEYLDEEWARKLIDKLWNEAGNRRDEQERRHMILLVQVLAKEIKDPALYEKAVKTYHPDKLPIAVIINIAEVYFDSGDPGTALSWLEKLPEGEVFQADRRDELLSQVYQEIGDQENRVPVAWRIFRRHRSMDSLNVLTEVIGRDQWNSSLPYEIKLIQSSSELVFSDAEFLFDCGRVDEAEKYIRVKQDKLDGSYYSPILKLAGKFEGQSRYLVVSVLYRALLDSILERGIAKNYHFGVRYLRKLDQLSGQVPDWGEFSTHKDYSGQIQKKHGLKKSFWSRYSN